MKESTIYLYGLLLIALFALGCVLSFGSGFKQGVIKAEECIENKGFIELGFNSFECKISNSSSFNDLERFKNFNFTGVLK